MFFYHFMLEGWILFGIGFLWILFASVQDVRTREIYNWISFSLIVFALGFRFFYGLFSEDFSFFVQGVIGPGIFFIIGNGLYYARMFAGGDTKLMIALGAVLPFSQNFRENVEGFILFVILFLASGAVYGLVMTLIISVKKFTRFKKGYAELFTQKKRFVFLFMVFGIVFLVLGFIERVFFSFGIMLFVFPYLYVYAKAVDTYCMVKRVKTKELTEGDWLFAPLRVGKRKITPRWEGLSYKDILAIRKKHRFVKIKYGIPFVPVFLLAYSVFLYLVFSGVWKHLFWF